jgi:peptidoglycan/xylan/chitin deacetylase (PgdA/CDA1 family)
MPEEQFHAQIKWLTANAALCSTRQILEGKDSFPLQVAISFDDGYASLKDVVAPILNQIGIGATVYLTTGQIGISERKLSDERLGHYPGERFLCWDDITALAEQDWLVGSHGVDHVDLTKTPDTFVRMQLSDSKKNIESMTARPCEQFAYTWGRSTPRLQALVAEAGYRYAMSGRHASLANDPSHMNCLEIPRMNISNEYLLDDFRAIICGDWDYLGKIQAFRARFS